ncbi:MAG: Rieske 2Fe-2S domain-containing protein [Geitlerinemataceae cyanobacterium]
MDRRKFLGWVGTGMLASSLPVVIAACTETTEPTTDSGGDSGGGGDTPLDTSIRPDGFQALATTADLDAKGTILDSKNAAQPVLIYRQPETQQVAAVNPQCPHQGCNVEWQTELKIFACPCHGSKFGSDGALVTGPSKAPLANFETKQEGDLILVKVT